MDNENSSFFITSFPLSSSPTREGPERLKTFLLSPSADLDLNKNHGRIDKTSNSRDGNNGHKLDVDTIMATTMKKVENYYSLFGSDLMCSGTTSECTHSIGEDFGIILKNSLIMRSSWKDNATKGDDDDWRTLKNQKQLDFQLFL